jgi:deoxyribonuclease-4
MNKLNFLTAGIPHRAKGTGVLGGLREVKRLGLDGMELEFVRGVYMREPLAREAARVAEGEGLALTVHAPYYINFHAKDPEKRRQSARRLFEAARIGRMAGAVSIAFHAGFYLGDAAERTYASVLEGTKAVRARLARNGSNGAALAPELTGKPTQWGDLEELLRLSRDVEGVAPCIDFAHGHARSNGKHNSYEEFTAMLGRVEKALGRRALKRLHIHVAGIRYGAKGELSHLDLEDSDMDYRALLRALRNKKVAGWLVCESPNIEGDARLLKRTYEALS